MSLANYEPEIFLSRIENEFNNFYRLYNGRSLRTLFKS